MSKMGDYGWLAFADFLAAVSLRALGASARLFGGGASASARVLPRRGRWGRGRRRGVSFRQGEERGDDLVYGVALDDAAAVEAGDGAAAGVEEAEVVVDLGGGGDGGAGVAGLVLLLDGDGGGEAVHVVDVGFFDALEELAGVGGEGFDVAALAFGVDGVEGERGFAGAGDSADDGEGVVGDVDVDALEVVGAGAADCYLVIHAQILF